MDILLPEFKIEQSAFDKVFSCGHLQKMLRFDLAAERMAEIGSAIIEQQGDTGQLALDEEKTMMQEAFRRLAEDVIKPRAESIHRHDLTVPEEILQPLREMGVFGISVPQSYGGIAPDDAHDNISMIVVTEALSEASLAAGGSLITRPEDRKSVV